jgi:hypothetical protein
MSPKCVPEKLVSWLQDAAGSSKAPNVPRDRTCYSLGPVELLAIALRAQQLEVYQVIAAASGKREHVINVPFLAQLLHNVYTACTALPTVSCS